MKISKILPILTLGFFLLNCESGGDQGHMMDRGMMGHRTMMESIGEAIMSDSVDPEMREDMPPIRDLLMNHEKIERRVEDLDNGVKTWTTSEDPEIAATIQKHVRQMHERIEEKKPIREMDPLFRELFEHADKIDMQIEDLENGVLVIETSQDPQVVKLIRQHAHKAVSEFAEQGMQRAMEPTPLPEGYQE
jgi:uncharacterized protein YdcH (DUF465 family)